MRVLILTLLLIIPGLSYAQTTLPAFTLPSGEDNQIQRLPPPATADGIDNYPFFQNNTYLRDLIKIQNQIHMLEKLLQRQTEIERIAEIYESMGMEYRRPAPPFAVCRQLPPNSLCLNHYPALYRDINQDVQRQIKTRVEELITLIETTENEVSSSLTQARNARQSMRDETGVNGEKLVKADYRWNDIFCIAGSCQAILQDVENRAFIRQVALGATLPDGSVVASISADGVMIKPPSGDKAVDILPVPAGGLEAIPDEDNPYGMPGLISLDAPAPPSQMIDLPDAPSAAPVAASAPVEEVTVTETEEGESGPNLAVPNSTPPDQPSSDPEPQELQSSPLLPATGLTF